MSRMNDFANPLNRCPKCDRTRLVHTSNENCFEMTYENKVKLLNDIFKANPHLKYKWKTAEDYMYVYECFPVAEMSWCWAEMYAVDDLEMRCSSWPFSDAKYYNPYWNLSKEDFDNLNNEIMKIYNK